VRPEQAAAAARKAVNALGSAFLDCPITLSRAREWGLSGSACYIAGRGGALGDVRPDVAAAALGLIAPEAVRVAWEAARSVRQPSEVAACMREECRRWGDANLTSVPRVHRLVTLAEAVVAAADSNGLPLFAAWRTMPVPEDVFDGLGAQAAVALHLLHEHRAGALIFAIRCTGMSPVQALLAGPKGEATAAAFGWQPPYPPRAQSMRKRAWADTVADHMAGQAWRVLSPKERAELVSLLNEARTHANLG